jgi:hypothetical protein
MLDGPQSRYGRCGEKKNLLSLPGIKPVVRLYTDRDIPGPYHGIFIVKLKVFKPVFNSEMGRAYSTNGAKRNGYMTLVGKPVGKRLLGRSRPGWVDNIKMDHRWISWGGMDWISLA